MKRAPRSTQKQLCLFENYQTEVIARLITSGHDDLAQRLLHCQQERGNRGSGWPWRCRTAGCWACRRTLIRNWWRGFRIWLNGPESSMITLSIADDPMDFIRGLRRGLRDVRDRAAKNDHRWQSVAMGGLADGPYVKVLIQHNGITRAEAEAVLTRRWSSVVVTETYDFEPSILMPVNQTANLARHRRGIEGIRVVVFPQRQEWGAPMPAVF